MRITSLIFVLSLYGYCHAQAQSWTDQIPAIIQEEKASIVVSDYFADKSLFDRINHLRSQRFLLESLPFDTTGQYTNAKKQLNQFLPLTAQNISMIPIRSHGGGITSRKTLNFDNSGHMEVSLSEINTSLMDQLFEKNIKNCLDTWFSNSGKNQVFQSNGLSAVAAMKVLIIFEKKDNTVRVTWKYACSYTLNTLPENMARSSSQIQIGRSKKP